jgi:hypothetical protein
MLSPLTWGGVVASWGAKQIGLKRTANYVLDRKIGSGAPTTALETQLIQKGL